MLTITTATKVFIGKDDVMLGLALAILWGVGNGGGTFLLRSILADVYEYDQLITGERRSVSSSTLSIVPICPWITVTIPG